MKYRALDQNGDYTFGSNGSNFYVDSPSAVAQAVKTRLGLIRGEWFLDTTAGTPYSEKILGAGKIQTYDAAIQRVILGTRGVRRIVSYSSYVDRSTRAAKIECLIDTAYGIITMQGAQKVVGTSYGSILDINFYLDNSFLM